MLFTSPVSDLSIRGRSGMIPLSSTESKLVEFALRMDGNVIHELVK